MKKIFLGALLVPAMVFAQTYPSPTFNSLTLQNPLTVANGGTGAATSTGSGPLVLSNSPALVTPNLGTPSAAVLTNATGLPISTGVSGLGAGMATALSNPASGSGNLVFSSSPTLVSPLFTNGSTTDGTIVGNPTPSSLAPGLLINQSVSGTTTVNCTTTTLIMYPCANLFYVSSDSAAAGSPTNAFDEWQFAANFGGSTLTGARQTMDIVGHFTAPSSPSNTNTGYDALAAEMITNSGDGGTAPTISGGRGSFFGTNPLVIANSGAQNLYGIAGEEIDVGCNGCSTALRLGLSVDNFGTTQAAMLGNDAAVHIGSIGSGTTGSWHQAINLSNLNGGAPLDSTGCVICTDSTSNTIATGIDLHNYNITGYFLDGPSGFTVNGSGALVAPGGIGTSGGLNVSAGGASVSGGLNVSGATNVAGALNATTLQSTGFAKVFAANTSGQSIASGGPVPITNWTKAFDLNNNFVPSTGVFTAPATGYYFISAQITFGTMPGAGASNILKAAIYVNGSDVNLDGYAAGSNTTQLYNPVNVSGILQLNANQIVQLNAVQTTGSPVSLLTSPGAVSLNIYQLP